MLLMAVGLMSVSCEEEKLDTSMRIPGLGGEEYIPNEIDEWLYDNFTAPYNIEVIYRWDASQVQSSWLRPIVPVEEDSVVTFMTAIRDVWFEPYERAVGDVFLKKMTPKQVVLGGSGEYQFGAIKLGQAEGGLKILLLNVNNFDRSTDISDPEQETSPEGANCIRQFLHTIASDDDVRQNVRVDQRRQVQSDGVDRRRIRRGSVFGLHYALCHVGQGRGLRRNDLGHHGVRPGVV